MAPTQFTLPQGKRRRREDPDKVEESEKLRRARHADSKPGDSKQVSMFLPASAVLLLQLVLSASIAQSSSKCVTSACVQDAADPTKVVIDLSNVSADNFIDLSED